jgi:5-hydroxyisourate hydrolase-like protein (transthyretin family)
MAGGVSIHCVDVASGRVVAGLRVTLHRLGSQGLPLGLTLAEGFINAKGLLEHPALMSAAIAPGGYEASFAVGDFYRSLGTQLLSQNRPRRANAGFLGAAKKSPRSLGLPSDLPPARK